MNGSDNHRTVSIEQNRNPRPDTCATTQIRKNSKENKQDPRNRSSEDSSLANPSRAHIIPAVRYGPTFLLWHRLTTIPEDVPIVLSRCLKPEGVLKILAYLADGGDGCAAGDAGDAVAQLAYCTDMSVAVGVEMFPSALV